MGVLKLAQSDVNTMQFFGITLCCKCSLKGSICGVHVELIGVYFLIWICMQKFGNCFRLHAALILREIVIISSVNFSSDIFKSQVLPFCKYFVDFEKYNDSLYYTGMATILDL